ncbi:putative AlkP superfamily phosphohydrolase/phosphomutase [Desulfobaculum xiamenense]|uniref:Putative AlkP superfamily phosphohydrolase/phosphomutase n=1 Tax=Desulfobaculum xiamenense TaxID=995050 RepID=A0A846QNC3_9BACT|nr:alkaline phosphatase family protein [Desulfobaculum xiamenense]NJB68687.1 putative AlkP superfamily phosphohydrolase/phosphomutase [Desulfobaculum xiamenense]
MNRRRFLGACAIGALGGALGFPAILRARRGAYRRVLLLGMDGIDFGLVREFCKAGHLPSFQRLLESGTLAPLATSTPPQSPVSWTCIGTGVGPGAHGMFDFLERDPKRYLPRLAITRLEGGGLFGDPRYVNPVQARPFWDELADTEIPATVIKWPVTFPAPDKSRVRLLSGMGVPDVQGNIGRYTFYTDAPDDGGPAGHKLARLEFVDGMAHSEVRGPLVAGIAGTSPATLELVVTRTEKGVRVSVDGRTADLVQGRFSDWMPMRFDMGFGRSMSAIGRFCLVEAAPHVRLYLTPLNLDPVDPAFPISSPPDYAAEMSRAVGRYATLGIPADTKALTEGRLTEETFLDFCDGLLTEQERLFEYEFGRFETGLLAGVLFTTDRVQHMFWAARDPQHPLHTPDYARRYGSVLPDLYRRMDRQLGRILAEIGDDTLFLAFSDHGFGPYRHSVHLNRWLAERGHLALTGKPDPGDPDAGALFANVDWKHTAAYAMGLNSIYVNLEGREGEGVVSESARSALVARIASELEDFRDPQSGARVVEAAFPAASAYGGAANAPDIVVGFRPGYRASWQTAVGGCPEEIVSANTGRWSGDHCIAPGFVPGMVCSNRPLAGDSLSVYDIAPTVLAALGLDTPRRYVGRNCVG